MTAVKDTIKKQTKSEKFWSLMNEIYNIKIHIKNAKNIWEYLGKNSPHGESLMLLISDLSTKLNEKQTSLKKLI